MINSDVVFETQFNPFRPNPWRREKMMLNFYFYDSFGASKGFMKALKALLRHHKEKRK